MVDATLKKLYYSLSEPSALSGVDRLLKHAKKTHLKLKRKDVEKWLQGQDSYTLYKPANRKLRAGPRVFVKHIDSQWGVDLCDMQDVAQHNNARYILTCIDIFSKFSWAVPVARKDGASVANAFKKILNSTTRRPDKLESDKGKEFYNPQFGNVLASTGIDHFSSNSRHKCSVVERFNRSLKTLIYRSFEARNSLDWESVLPNLLNVYNSRYHRSIKMAPKDVNAQNEAEVYQNLYSKRPKVGKILKSGQLVRISKLKRVFDKGYWPNFTEEVFKIVRVHNKRPMQYELEDLLGEEVEGKFVAEELSVVNKRNDDVWKIEKVLKKDRNGYLVKWRGFPPKFNSYVRSIQVR